MEERNHSSVTSFILLGFTTDPKLQLLLFMVFTLAYITILVGNITLIMVIRRSSRLHTPMYFFTGNLSFLDLWYSSVYTPKILLNCVSEDKSISLAGCAAQFFVSGGLAHTECYLLAAMACNRYVAVSNPLLYAAAMSKKLCLGLVAASYLGGFANSTFITSHMFAFSFCDTNVIDDFFCHLPPRWSSPAMWQTATRRSCISSWPPVSSSPPRSSSCPMPPSWLPSWRRAQPRGSTKPSPPVLPTSPLSPSTTAPSSLFMPQLQRDKAVSVFYTVMIPMQNPFIYSLRNREVKGALKRLVKRQTAS